MPAPALAEESLGAKDCGVASKTKRGAEGGNGGKAVVFGRVWAPLSATALPAWV